MTRQRPCRFQGSSPFSIPNPEASSETRTFSILARPKQCPSRHDRCSSAEKRGV